MKERLDVLLVKRGLAASREKAKAVIMAGSVFRKPTILKRTPPRRRFWPLWNETQHPPTQRRTWIFCPG